MVVPVSLHRFDAAAGGIQPGFGPPHAATDVPNSYSVKHPGHGAESWRAQAEHCAHLRCVAAHASETRPSSRVISRWFPRFPFAVLCDDFDTQWVTRDASSTRAIARGACDSCTVKHQRSRGDGSCTKKRRGRGGLACRRAQWSSSVRRVCVSGQACQHRYCTGEIQQARRA